MKIKNQMKPEIQQFMDIYTNHKEAQQKLKDHKLTKQLKRLTKEKNSLKKTLMKMYEDNPQQLQTDTEGKITISNVKVPIKTSADEFKSLLIKHVGNTSQSRAIINFIDNPELKDKVDIIYEQ